MKQVLRFEHLTMIDFDFHITGSHTSRKRKNDDSDSTKQPGDSATKQDDDSLFKIPTIPTKVRKTQTNSSPHIDPSIVANVYRTPQQSAGTPSTSSSSDSTPIDIQALFNASVEKSTDKMTGMIRTVVNEMLHEFWDATKPAQQLQQLENKLITMRSDYERELNVLQHQNETLKLDLKSLNGKCDTQSVKIREMTDDNSNMNANLNAAKLKMVAISMDLKRSEAK